MTSNEIHITVAFTHCGFKQTLQSITSTKIINGHTSRGYIHGSTSMLDRSCRRRQNNLRNSTVIINLCLSSSNTILILNSDVTKCSHTNKGSNTLLRRRNTGSISIQLIVTLEKMIVSLVCTIAIISYILIITRIAFCITQRLQNGISIITPINRLISTKRQSSQTLTISIETKIKILILDITVGTIRNLISNKHR